MNAPVTLVVAGDPVPNYDAIQHLIERQNEVRTDLVVSNLELRAALRALVVAAEGVTVLGPAGLFHKAIDDAKALLVNGGRL